MEKGEFPFIWYLSQYPSGKFTFEPMGLYYTSVLFYKIFKPFGISFLGAFKLVTPLFGALTIIPFYFLTRHIFNKRVAILSAIILAFLPAFLFRTFSGFYRGDSLSLPFAIAGFYLFLLSLNSETKKNIAFSISAGISLGFMSLVWDGYLYGFVILSAFAILYSIMAFIQGKDSKGLLLSYLISIGLGILILKYSVIVQPDRRFQEDLIRYILPSTIIFIGVLEAVKLKTRHINAAKRAFMTLSIALFSFVIIWKIDPDLISRLSTGYYGEVSEVGTLLRSIGELRPPTIKILWQKYNIILLLFPLGFVHLLEDLYNERSKEKLFLLTWVSASIYLLIHAQRFAFLASLPIAILSALFLERFGREILPKNAPKTRKIPQIIAIIFLLTIIFSGISFANHMAPVITKEWHDALTFLKNEEEGNVLTWWDYGSWVQYVTGFPTVVDTVHGQGGPHEKIAEFFLETDESKTFDLLRKYHVDYVIVPTDMMWQLHNMASALNTSEYEYTLYPYTNTIQFKGLPTDVYANKFYVLNTKEGKRVLYKGPNKQFLPVENVYYAENDELVVQEYTNLSSSFVEGGVYVDERYVIYISPKLIGTLLNSLMLLDGKDFNSYKLIYSNPQVRIYKPVYDYIRIDDLKTDKLHYKTGENISIHLKVKSSIPFNRDLELKVLNPDDIPLFFGEYNATENTSLDISFTPPVDSVLGNYKIVAEMLMGGPTLSCRDRDESINIWYSYGNGTDEVSYTGGLFGSGYRHIEATSEEHACLTSERIPIEAGQNYSVTVYVKGIKGTNKSAYLALTWGNWSIGGGNISKTITYIDDFSSKYKPYVLTGTAPPGATQVRVDLRVNCPATIEIEPADTELYINGMLDVYLERIIRVQD